jgi:hypothetical protein
MSRKTTIFSGVILTLTVPFVFGQDQPRRAPNTPEDLLASSADLIAWSYMQEPKPVPQPLPPPDKGIPQPDTQPSQPPEPQAPAPVSNQTFTGTIVKDSGKFVLKVSENASYDLDQQGSLEQFENKDVKVVGTVEPGGNTIHIAKIELLP